MPTVFRRDGLRYSFFSDEGDPREPPHIHVSGGGADAKIWLEPEVAIALAYGFNSKQLNWVLQIVHEERDSLLRAWHDHFG